MIKIMTVIFLSSVFISCNKKVKVVNPDEISRMADSMLLPKIEALKKEAQTDYDRRLPIELKPKVDSILNKSMQINSPSLIIDSTIRDSIQPLEIKVEDI